FSTPTSSSGPTRGSPATGSRSKVPTTSPAASSPVGPASPATPGRPSSTATPASSSSRARSQSPSSPSRAKKAGSLRSPSWPPPASLPTSTSTSPDLVGLSGVVGASSDRLLELPHAGAKRSADLGHPSCSEKEHDEEQEQQEVKWALESAGHQAWSGF